MFRRTLIASSLLLASAVQAATVGQPAPAFTVADTSGKAVNLADFKGKTVVLEWTNPGCPFVQKHYKPSNMQNTQRGATGDGVVWLTVSSTNPQAKDYKKPAELAAWMGEQKAAATHTLMDDDGKVGKAYGARTTPHLYVINPAGTLVYAGAIDSKPTGNPADIATATNYVNQALGELKAGKAISQPTSQPYGCSIKYAS
ncbi:MAG: thioredoxin family protein [Burkholderiales bacterium]|uniref:thioredoxin family protein n=1 Tax=Inhella sp. TaxID=1921806 RepID=UPI001ACAF8D6|nr:thioredoxin family protein [Burkholderiales bacterium]